MDFPSSLHYTKDHEWVRIDDGSEMATIGITEFAQSELGDIVFVELEPVGDAFSQDEVFGSVEAVKAVADLFMPVSGTIIAHNDALEDDPALVNNDPYGDGWMIKVRLDGPAEGPHLLSAEEYGEHVA